MIYSFGAKNYFSFKHGFNVSFELNSKVPKKISKGNKVSNIIGIKGANASGKTHILKALHFIFEFCSNSFGYDEDESLNFTSYYRSETPVDFYIDFETSGVRYIYELKANREKVIQEKLYRKLNRKILMVERQGNSIKSRIEDLKELDMVELKSNASIISTATKYKLKKLDAEFSNIYEFFRACISNVGYAGMLDNLRFFSIDSASEFYYKNERAFNFAKKFISSCDNGIVDIEIHSTHEEDGSVRYFPVFIHEAGADVPKLNRWVIQHHESSGTLALFRKLRAYWLVLETGGLLIMDEFDVNCHPLLLPHILSLFENEETNKHNAQFIFTAHSTEIIDFLGKYKAVLVNKEEGVSYCYRLDEIPGDLVRNDRPISNVYKEGKIGGIPML